MIEKKELRLVGLGIVVSAFVTMIYEVVQIALKLPFDSPTTLNSDEIAIGIKFSAIIPAIFIGLGLVKYFNVKVANPKN